jgi:hypothetical protein
VSQKLFYREKSSFRKRGIEASSGMALTKYKTITIWMLRSRRVDFEYSAVKHRKDIGA